MYNVRIHIYVCMYGSIYVCRTILFFIVNHLYSMLMLLHVDIANQTSLITCTQSYSMNFNALIKLKINVFFNEFFAISVLFYT